MLTIERESSVRNKLVIASLVFGVGFIGSLSMLRVLWPESEQLSSGRPSQTVSRAERTEPDKEQDINKENESSGKADVASGASSSAAASSDAVVPPIVNQPTTAYTAPTPTQTQPSTGTVQVSGTMPETTQQPASGTTVTTPLPTSPISAPSLTSPTSPTTPLSPEQGTTSPSATSPTSPQTDPVTSLTQTLSDTTETLLPSF